MNPTDLIRLDGKTALITGGNRGIGKAIAKDFTAAGAKVWIAAGNEENGLSAADEIGCTFVKMDLASSDEIQKLVRRISAGIGLPESVVYDRDTMPLHLPANALIGSVPQRQATLVFIALKQLCVHGNQVIDALRIVHRFTRSQNAAN